MANKANSLGQQKSAAPLCFLLPVICGVPGGCAAGNRGADCVKLLAPALAPEQRTRPNTVNRTIKLRLLARPPVPVSTAIIQILESKLNRNITTILSILERIEIQVN
ncbi:MAG: hypothetical protein WAL98_10375 [Desulfatiglandaceae bacterium]|jgi:hypothetical protein